MSAVTLKPCTKEHLTAIRPFIVQEDEKRYSLGDVSQVLAAGLAFSAWRDEQCLGAGGLFKHWPGRAEAWLLLDRDAVDAMRPLLRHLRFILDTYPCRRVEMVVLAENAAGHRIARALSFRREGLLKAYHVNGGDAVMYARVR